MTLSLATSVQESSPGGVDVVLAEKGHAGTSGSAVAKRLAAGEELDETDWMARILEASPQDHSNLHGRLESVFHGTRDV